ncbi:MAG TPA: fibronectin type III domain-containing protein [Trebonia sp.]|nr:fibronectin type III domain-containing protein [Trebonia sp.]
MTVTQPTATSGVLTVYPDGESPPAASNLNFVSGETVPNLVVVQVGSDGKVGFYNSSGGTVQVVADLSGYFVSPLGAPTAVTAKAGNAQATVSWTAPASNGGSPVTGYTVTASNGATVSAAATATSATVTGLTNGTAYTFTVAAANATGTGPASAASSPVTPSGPPGAPTAVTATAGNGQATVTWTAPASTGGGAITSYTVTASPGTATATVAGTVTTTTVTGLANGTAYTFTVTAATAGGPGPASAASSPVTPATVPGAPTAVKATAGNGQATVTWTAPATSGGSPVTGYTITASDGTTATAAATATSATVTGLTNGTSYTFTVTATNAIGTSATSTASNAVTPAGPPDSPDFSAWTVGNGQVALAWSAPDNGGAAITGYTITAQPGGATYPESASATSATITGLTNGTSYTFALTATNSIGTSPADAIGPVTPVSAPGAPTAVTAVAASTSATVSWAPPATNSSMITGYTVTAAPGGASVTVAGTATMTTVTGLANGTSYTFTVTATDPGGTGPASAASNPVTPGPVPGSPTAVQATAGNATAQVTWTAPASSGGSAISGYTVTATPGGATATVAGGVTDASFTGLTNGTDYRFTVVATNSYGTSIPSPSSAPVTPAAPVPPDAPFITNVTGEDSAVEVTWTPPDTGTANLTGYVITTTTGGATVSTTNEPASATEANVTGLTDGTQYTFAIAAVNGVGTGTSSPPSVPVSPRPATAPMAPANLMAVAQNGQIQVGWVAPPDGGSPITSYTVSVTPADASPVSVAANTTVATVTGLTNGTAYTVSVTAANAAGTSPAAQAGPATPEASIVPGAPINLIASATAAGSVSLEWTPPTDPGTASVTTYTVSASTGGTVAKTQSVPATACTGSPVQCTSSVTGLNSADAYTFTLTATNTAGTGPASQATDPVTPNVTSSQTVVSLSSASMTTLAYVDTDGTLIFASPPAQVTSLATGNYVYAPPGPQDPQGILAQVQAVTSQGGFVEVATTQATLNDIFSAYDTSIDAPFNGATAQILNPAPGVSVSRPMVNGKTLVPAADEPADSPFSIGWSNGGVTLSLDMDLLQGDSAEGSTDSSPVSPEAKLEGSVTLAPVLHVHPSWSNLGFTIGGQVKADLKAELGVQGSVSKTVYLGETQGPTFYVQVGWLPVPVRVVFQAYAVVSASGTVGIEYTASYDHTWAATCDVHFTTTSGDTCSSADTDGGDSGGLSQGSDVYGTMNITTGVKLTASLQIEYLAGPEVTVTPELIFNSDLSANPWWTLDLQGDLGVAVTALQVFGQGKVIYENDDLLTIGPYQLASAGGAFGGLSVSPGEATIAPGATQAFKATLYQPTGITSPSSVTWSVVSGPGTIDSSGNFTATGDGTAVVQATVDGFTGRAGVIITGTAAAPTGQGNIFGGVDSIDVGWSYLGGPPDPLPTEYAVTAAPEDPSYPSSVVYVPGSHDHAYLGDLLPGVAYDVTVYAVGAAGGQVTSQQDVVPLDPLPAVVTGTGNLTNIAFDRNTVTAEDTGFTGGWDQVGEAAISGNGQYAFFYADANSNLAPASISSPDNDLPYLVREDLLTGDTAVASIGLDGHTPISVYTYGQVSSFGAGLEANADGSVVVYPALLDNITVDLVYDFATETTWEVGSSAAQVQELTGLSANGTVVSYMGDNGHVYRQAAGGAPQQVDSCPVASEGSCSVGGNTLGSGGSMSASGNLIAYVGYGPLPIGAGAFAAPEFEDMVYLFNEATGQDTAMFPGHGCTAANPYGSNCVSYTNPVLSGDGSTLAVATVINTEINNQAGYSLATITTRIGSGVNSNVAAPSTTLQLYPVALDTNGGVLIAASFNWVNASLGGPQESTQLDYFAGTSLSVAPELSSTSLDTASLTSDGSTVLFTEVTIGATAESNGLEYQGVYEWQP